jgi:hypothetical protein
VCRDGIRFVRRPGGEGRRQVGSGVSNGDDRGHDRLRERGGDLPSTRRWHRRRRESLEVAFATGVDRPRKPPCARLARLAARLVRSLRPHAVLASPGVAERTAPSDVPPVGERRIVRARLAGVSDPAHGSCSLPVVAARASGSPSLRSDGRASGSTREGSLPAGVVLTPQPPCRPRRSLDPSRQRSVGTRRWTCRRSRGRDLRPAGRPAHTEAIVISIIRDGTNI